MSPREQADANMRETTHALVLVGLGTLNREGFMAVVDGLPEVQRSHDEDSVL